MTPVAGDTHHVVFTDGGVAVGFMIEPGSYLGPQTVADFAPRIATGTDPTTREGIWDSFGQTGAVEGIDQLRFTNPAKIYRSDGNVWFGRDEAVTLNSLSTSSDASKSATAPMIIDFGTTMQLVGVGTKVRRYVAAAWADSTTTFASAVVWLHRHNNYVFAACGTGDALQRSTDADTWSESAGAGETAACFATWKEKLYKAIGSTLKASSNNGGSFQKVAEVGDPNTNILAMCVAFQNLVIRKEDGLYLWNGSEVIELYRNQNALYSGNKTLCYHSDGFLYMGELARIKKVSYAGSGLVNMTDATPVMVGTEEREHRGHGIPKWIWSGPGDNLYVAFDDGEGVYPEVLFHNGLGWHQYYRGASGDTMNAGGYSRLLAYTFYNDGATRYRKQTTLADEPFEEYATSGQWETSDYEGGRPFNFKAYREIRLKVRNLGSDRTIAVSYSEDEGANYTAIATLNTDGTFKFPISTTQTAVGARRMRYKFVFTRGATTSETPVLERWDVQFLLRPDPLYAYAVNVKIATGQLTLASPNVRDTRTTADNLDFLRRAHASREPIQFTDPEGQDFNVYIQRLNTVQRSLNQRADERIVTVEMVESTTEPVWNGVYWNGFYWL